MNIDQLLSPYRGFRPPTTDTLDTETDDTDLLALDLTPRMSVLRATRIDRGPELPSPESWEMFEFVQALTA